MAQKTSKKLNDKTDLMALHEFIAAISTPSIDDVARKTKEPQNRPMIKSISAVPAIRRKCFIIHLILLMILLCSPNKLLLGGNVSLYL
jgi:hypothetical protein